MDVETGRHTATPPHYDITPAARPLGKGVHAMRSAATTKTAYVEGDGIERFRMVG